MEYLIKTKSIGGMTEDQFFDFCQENHGLKLERNAEGEIIIIMAPTGLDGDRFNTDIIGELVAWNKELKAGVVFGNNGGFTLPNNAVRSPDAAFITLERWAKIPKQERKKFAHVCPDFVIEILSETDRLSTLCEKMKEWMDSGCQLAWLVDPQRKETWIFRSYASSEVVSFDTVIGGERVLPGFEIDLAKIFQDD